MPKKVESAEARARGEEAMHATHANVNAKSLAKLETILRDVAKKKPAPLSVMQDDAEGTAAWNRQLVDVAIVELARSLGSRCAEKELHNKPLRELYARAMPEDPSEMYDGDVMIERLGTAWSAS